MCAKIYDVKTLSALTNYCTSVKDHLQKMFTEENVCGRERRRGGIKIKQGCLCKVQKIFEKSTLTDSISSSDEEVELY